MFIDPNHQAVPAGANVPFVGQALLYSALLAFVITFSGCDTPTPAANAIVTPVAAVFQNDPGAPFFGSVEIRGLATSTLASLTRAPHAEDDLPPAAAVAVFTNHAIESRGDTATPLPGRLLVEPECLRFVPRFPLRTGMTYRVRVDRTAIDVAGDGNLWLRLELPGPPSAPTTRVVGIYPGSPLLPENLLKFTLHFSAPMSPGDALDHIRLLRDSGETVELPFLDQELWNGNLDRLTLLLHPGHIRRGSRPHRKLGRPLGEGERLRLVVAADWRDGEGQPLVAGAEKVFLVGPPDREAPDPAGWTVNPPSSGSRHPLQVFFSEPLDRALLERTIAVRDELGTGVPGVTEVGPEERSWRFTPDAPWEAGPYRLEIEPILEDLAGNNLEGLFDLEIGVDRPEHRRDLVRRLFVVVTDEAPASAFAGGSSPS